MAIGDQRLSRQVVQAPNPQLSSDAFGAGVARGLQNIAQAQLGFEQSEVELAEMIKRVGASFKERELKLERAKATATLIRTRAETAEELEQLRRDWPEADGKGFADAAAELARQRAESFNSALSPELQAEFEPRIAEFETTFATSGFEVQLQAGDTAFQASVSDVTQRAINEILSNQLTLEDAVAELDDLLDSSPLTENQTQAIAQEVFQSLQLAAFSVEAQASARSPLLERGALPAPAPATGVFATGLSPEITGFLSAVGGVESSNEYNRLFSHEGKRTFSDFSKHPNSPAEIKSGPNKGKVSTAAGRYQIIKETWDRAAAALGLEDFSPANQDRAAVWIAQEAYGRVSGGKSIEQALRSGDPAQIEQVRRILSGESGSGVVYEGLQNMSPQEFFAKVTSGEQTPGAIVNDERFSSVPFSQRQALYSDALNAEAARQTEVAKQAQAARDASIAELIANIKLGRAGESEILAANQTFSFNAVELEKISAEFDKKFEDQIAVGRFQARLASPTFAFDSSEKAERDTANLFAAEAFAPVFEEQDGQAFAQNVVPFVERTRFVPNMVQENLLRASRSANPEEAEFGFRGMQSLFELDAATFEKSFGAEGIALVQGFLGAQLRGQPLVEFQSEVRARATSPQFFEQIDATIAKQRKDNPSTFTVQSIATEVAGNIFSAPTLGNQAQGFAIFREYDALLRNAMITTGDFDDAHKAAIATLKTRFGETEIGGEAYLLRRPPQNYYKPVNGGHKWIEQQVREELALPDDTPFRLISDGQTEQEISRKQAPSYMIFTETNGVFAPQMVDAGDGRALPARMNFKPTTEMTLFEIDRVLLSDEVFKLREEDQAIRQRALQVGAGSDEDRARLQEIENLIREKEEQLRVMERKFR